MSTATRLVRFTSQVLVVPDQVLYPLEDLPGLLLAVLGHVPTLAWLFGSFKALMALMPQLNETLDRGGR